MESAFRRTNTVARVPWGVPGRFNSDRRPRGLKTIPSVVSEDADAVSEEAFYSSVIS